MFSLNYIVLPLEFKEKLYFLNVKFGEVYFYTQGRSELTFWIISGLILVLFFNNSMEYKSKFRNNKFYGFLFLFLMLSGIMNLTNISEFLYFNF